MSTLNKFSGGLKDTSKTLGVTKPVDNQTTADKLLQTQKRNEQLATQLTQLNISEKDVEKVNDQRNILQKLLNLKDNQGLITGSLAIMGRLGEGIQGAIASSTTKENIAKAFYAGVSGNKEYTLSDLGVKIDNPLANAVASMAFEVAADPLNFMTLPIASWAKAGKGVMSNVIDKVALFASKTPAGQDIFNATKETFQKINDGFKKTFGTWNNNSYKDFNNNVADIYTQAKNGALEARQLNADLSIKMNELTNKSLEDWGKFSRADQQAIENALGLDKSFSSRLNSGDDGIKLSAKEEFINKSSTFLGSVIESNMTVGVTLEELTKKLIKDDGVHYEFAAKAIDDVKNGEVYTSFVDLLKVAANKKGLMHINVEDYLQVNKITRDKQSVSGVLKDALGGNISNKASWESGFEMALTKEGKSVMNEFMRGIESQQLFERSLALAGLNKQQKMFAQFLKDGSLKIDVKDIDQIKTYEYIKDLYSAGNKGKPPFVSSTSINGVYEVRFAPNKKAHDYVQSLSKKSNDISKKLEVIHFKLKSYNESMLLKYDLEGMLEEAETIFNSILEQNPKIFMSKELEGAKETVEFFNKELYGPISEALKTRKPFMEGTNVLYSTKISEASVETFNNAQRSFKKVIKDMEKLNKELSGDLEYFKFYFDEVNLKGDKYFLPFEFKWKELNKDESLNVFTYLVEKGIITTGDFKTLGIKTFNDIYTLDFSKVFKKNNIPPLSITLGQDAYNTDFLNVSEWSTDQGLLSTDEIEKVIVGGLSRVLEGSLTSNETYQLVQDALSKITVHTYLSNPTNLAKIPKEILPVWTSINKAQDALNNVNKNIIKQRGLHDIEQLKMLETTYSQGIYAPTDASKVQEFMKDLEETNPSEINAELNKIIEDLTARSNSLEDYLIIQQNILLQGHGLFNTLDNIKNFQKINWNPKRLRLSDSNIDLFKKELHSNIYVYKTKSGFNYRLAKPAGVLDEDLIVINYDIKNALIKQEETIKDIERGNINKENILNTIDEYEIALEINSHPEFTYSKESLDNLVQNTFDEWAEITNANMLANWKPLEYNKSYNELVKKTKEAKNIITKQLKDTTKTLEKAQLKLFNTKDFKGDIETFSKKVDVDLEKVSKALEEDGVSLVNKIKEKEELLSKSIEATKDNNIPGPSIKPNVDEIGKEKNLKNLKERLEKINKWDLENQKSYEEYKKTFSKKSTDNNTPHTKRADVVKTLVNSDRPNFKSLNWLEKEDITTFESQYKELKEDYNNTLLEEDNPFWDPINREIIPFNETEDYINFMNDVELVSYATNSVDNLSVVDNMDSAMKTFDEFVIEKRGETAAFYNSAKYKEEVTKDILKTQKEYIKITEERLNLEKLSLKDRAQADIDNFSKTIDNIEKGMAENLQELKILKKERANILNEYKGKDSKPYENKIILKKIKDIQDDIIKNKESITYYKKEIKIIENSDVFKTKSKTISTTHIDKEISELEKAIKINSAQKISLDKNKINIDEYNNAKKEFTTAKDNEVRNKNKQTELDEMNTANFEDVEVSDMVTNITDNLENTNKVFVDPLSEASAWWRGNEYVTPMLNNIKTVSLLMDSKKLLTVQNDIPKLLEALPKMFSDSIVNLSGVQMAIQGSIGRLFKQIFDVDMTNWDVQGYMRHMLSPEQASLAALNKAIEGQISSTSSELFGKNLKKLGIQRQYQGSAYDINKAFGTELFNTNPVEATAIMLDLLPESFTLGGVFKNILDSEMLLKVNLGQGLNDNAMKSLINTNELEIAKLAKAQSPTSFQKKAMNDLQFQIDSIKEYQDVLSKQTAHGAEFNAANEVLIPLRENLTELKKSKENLEANISKNAVDNNLDETISNNANIQLDEVNKSIKEVEEKIKEYSFVEGDEWTKINNDLKAKLELLANDVNKIVINNFVKTDAYLHNNPQFGKEFTWVTKDAVASMRNSFDLVKRAGGEGAVDADYIKGFEDILESIEKGNGVFAIHKGVVESIKRFSKNSSGGDVKSLFSTIQKYVTTPFKSFSLLSVGFHVRNLLTNYTNGYLAGINPVDLHHGMTVARGEQKIFEDMLKTVNDKLLTGNYRTADSQLKMISDMLDGFEKSGDIAKKNIWLDYFEMVNKGVIGNNQFNADITELLNRISNKAKGKVQNRIVKTSSGILEKGSSTFKSLMEFSFKTSKHMDDYAKIAMYRLVKNNPKYKNLLGDIGEGAEELSQKSAQFVKFTLFDYNNLTHAEEKYMKAIFPFYTWARKNLEFQLRNIGKNLKQYTRLSSAIQGWRAGMIGDEDNETGFYENYLPLWNSNGNISYLKFTPAYADVDKFLDGSALVNSLTPIIKMPLEMITGYDFFTRREFETNGLVPGIGLGLNNVIGTFGVALNTLFQNHKPTYEEKKLAGFVGQKLLLVAETASKIFSFQSDMQNNGLLNTLGNMLPSVFSQANIETSQYYNARDRLEKQQAALNYYTANNKK